MIELDKGHNLPLLSPICTFCQHWNGDEGLVCPAFQAGIPDAIWLGQNDHRKPYPGDHGIQFAQVPASPTRKALTVPPATDTPDPRDGDEAALRRALESLFRTLAPDVADMLARGEMPSDKELADAFAAVIRPALVNTSVEAFGRIAADMGIQFDPAMVNQRMVEWAQSYTYDMVKDITVTTLSGLRQAMTEYASTPGMTRAELERMIAPMFGKERAESIAITETTRANSRAWLGYQIEAANYGISMERVWHTRNDERVCPICGPLNGKPESKWGDVEEPPAHPRCRCAVGLRSVDAP